VNVDEQLWQLLQDVEFYALYDGWQIDTYQALEQALASSALAGEQVGDSSQSYSFLTNLKPKPSVQPQPTPDIMHSSSPSVDTISAEAIQLPISSWQELSDYVVSQGYRALEAYLARPKLMVVSSYGGNYTEAKEYVYKWLAAIGLDASCVYYSAVAKVDKSNIYPIVALANENAIICKEVELIQPQSLLVCGRLAYEALFVKRQSLSGSRMQKHQYGGVQAVVTYDPQMVLTLSTLRKDVWYDVQRLAKIVAELG
jgi:uracil-DNA glycosylase family 4